jgi:GT2 family glycosyltransferase
MAMNSRIFVGIPSFNRGRVFHYCVNSFIESRLIKGFILVIEALTEREREIYKQALEGLINRGFEVIYDINIGRRGSTKARNKILDISEENLGVKDILLLYDDDYLYTGDESVHIALSWLKNPQIGVVGGRVINLIRRKIDPDFSLNIRYLADAITRVTGFIFLDVKHGPRLVEYTTPLMAIKVEILSKGVRYDEKYGGTGYREESDLQRQVRELGYKIVFEPRFYAYHLALESGGNRYLDLEDRVYWKWRNHTYFMNKWSYPIHKKIFSYMVLTLYAIFNGVVAVNGILKAVRGRS